MGKPNTPAHPARQRLRNQSVELVTAIGAGSLSAERALITQYRPGLLAMLRQRARNEELAEDLCQETLIVVLQRLRRREVEAADRLAGFIMGVAKRLLLAEVRKAVRRDTNCDMETIERTCAEDHELWEQAYLGELRGYLLEQIERLRTERDRTVLKHVYFEERQKQDLLREMDLTSRRFDCILSRARSRLREVIEHDLGVQQTVALEELVAF